MSRKNKQSGSVVILALALFVVVMGLLFLSANRTSEDQMQLQTQERGLAITGADVVTPAGELTTQTERPVRGWIKYTSGAGVNGATVSVGVKLYAHLSAAFWCYCTSPNTTSASDGEWVENLNNLIYASSCLVTGKNPGDYCGNDWQDNSEIWMNYTGSTAVPPVDDGSTTPVNISDAPLIEGITYLENVTIAGSAPNTTLVGPVDGYANDSSDPNNFTFTCNATDDSGLANISLYLTDATNSSFGLNQTTAVSGVSNESSWTLELGVGNYTWNCLAINSIGNGDFGDENRSLANNYTAAGQTCAISGLINDALGDNVSSTVELYSSANVLVGSDTEDYNFSVPCDALGNYQYHLKVIPGTSNFNYLILNNVTVTADVDDLVDLETSPADTEGPGYFTNWTEIIAWNPSLTLNYTSVTINMSYNDTGLAFYKCASWNYTARNCTDDNWTYVDDLLDGAHNYENTFAAGDPAGGAAKKPIVEAYLFIYDVTGLNETERRDNGTFLGRYDNATLFTFNQSDAYRIEIFLNNTNSGSKAKILDPYHDNIPEELVMDLVGADAPNITVVLGSVVVNSFTVVNSTGTEVGTERITWDAPSPDEVIEDLDYGELVKLWYVVDFGPAQESLNNATFFGDVKGSNGDAYLVNLFNTTLEVIAPNVTLDSPASPYVNDSAALVNVTFNCSATDNVGLANLSLYLTDAANSSFALNQTTAISGVSNESSWTLELGVGNYTWNCLAFDTAGNNDWGDDNGSVMLNYSAPLVDNFPYWSINQTDVVSIYSPTTLSYFNITWQDDVGISTVWFESNYSGVQNYSMNGLGGDVYNYSAILPAGKYYWKSYANDTINQLNLTDEWMFTIAQAAGDINLYLNGSQANFTTQNNSYVNITATLPTGVGDIQVYNNGTLLHNGPAPAENITLFDVVGLYNITAIYAGNENYTPAMETWWVNVTTDVLDSTDPNVTLVYPNNVTSCPDTNIEFRFNVTDEAGTVQCDLYTNVTGSWAVTNSSNVTAPGAGAWNLSVGGLGNYIWSVNCTDAAGNSGLGENWTFEIFSRIDVPVLEVTKINDTALMMNWTNVSDSYNVYWSSNATAIIDLSLGDTSGVNNITGITALNWTDDTLTDVKQRYYRVSATDCNGENLSERTVGHYRIDVVAATGIPGTLVDLNLISIPLTPANTSVDSVITGASNNDVIYRYNLSTNNYESTQYFAGFGWFGAFAEIDDGVGYAFKPVGQNYNFSVMGYVPLDNFTVTILNSTGIPGTGRELNLMGWHTIVTRCNLSALVPNAANNDVIYRYNVTTQNYESTQYFAGFGWFGAFDCLIPGEGYEFKPVASDYSWTYERGGG